MTPESALAADVRVVSDAEIGACFTLMQQLRPHLASADDLVTRVRRQQAEGYRLLALWSARKPRALAGFRLTENLVHGRFLYVDDLVVDAAERSNGLGAILLTRLKDEARRLGCAKLVLDTGIDNIAAQRFYARQGLRNTALRFSEVLGLRDDVR
jgi:ribosomal protein S18 acetylase RimI-like enzyme